MTGPPVERIIVFSLYLCLFLNLCLCLRHCLFEWQSSNDATSRWANYWEAAFPTLDPGALLCSIVLRCVVNSKGFFIYFQSIFFRKKLPSQMTRWVMTQRVIWFGHFLLLEMKEQSIKEIDTSRASNCNNDPGSTQFILLLCDQKKTYNAHLRGLTKSHRSRGLEGLHFKFRLVITVTTFERQLNVVWMPLKASFLTGFREFHFYLR